MGRKESRQDRADQDSWNNVPTRAAKIQVGPLTPRCLETMFINDSSLSGEAGRVQAAEAAGLQRAGPELHVVRAAAAGSGRRPRHLGPGQRQQEALRPGDRAPQTSQQVGNIYLDCLNYLNCHCRLLRFAGLLDDDGDAAPLPPASVYHGRASEPAFRSGGGKQQQYNGARSG